MKSLIGNIIDNYHIHEMIGKGGMGVVYKAEDLALEKIVAIKVIDPLLARDESFLRRFRTEAKAMAKLNYPNIVTVHALRETDMGFFMVMEYVDSKTLSERIKEQGAFSVDETILITKQLLGAIGYAHNAGVIHRDIKPSNILISGDGHVKIMDFGLAKVMRNHGPESTVTHMRAGTLFYMSPEQVKGLKNVDVRSDLYSLGMTIYEMLAGRKPFEKTDTDYTIQKQIVDGKIPSPIKFNSNIPKPLVKIILKAISSDPTKRFQKAEDMFFVIEQFEQKKKQKIKTGKPGTGSNKKNKKKIIFSLTAISAFLLYTLLGVINFDASEKPGYLTVKTNPQNAYITVNQKIIGQSPVTEFELDAGKTSLEIKKVGYISIDTILIVENDEKYLFNFNLEKDGKENQVKKSINKEIIDFGKVKITSDPIGSSVFINSKRVGKTPFEDNNLIVGRYNLIIKKNDYVDFKSRITVAKNKLTPVMVKLIPTGKFEIESKPSNSTLYLNGSKLGTTPIRNQKLKTGNYKLKIEKKGYKDFDTVITINHKLFTSLSVSLKISSGMFKMLVRPYGSVFIDGKGVSENSIAQISKILPIGKYNIKAVHPTLGRWEKQIEILDGKTNEFVVDFNTEYEVIVTSTPNNAQIVIDGNLTGKYTPKLIKLRMGNHSISVQKKGYRVIGPAIEMMVEKKLDTPLHFELK